MYETEAGRYNKLAEGSDDWNVKARRRTQVLKT